jgi:hypothetical protein
MKSISVFIILIYLFFPIACFAQSDQRDIPASSEMDIYYISDYSDKQSLNTVQSDDCFDEHTATVLQSIHLFPEVRMHGFSMIVTLPHISIPIFVPPQNQA